MTNNLLEIKNLSTKFRMDDMTLTAIDGISFHVNREEIVGLVGESGSGKSVTSLSIMRLLPENGIMEGDEILLEGKNLMTLEKKEMRKIRGRDISMIFQDPMSSLNPVLKVGEQMMETTMLHLNHTKQEARTHALKMIEQVGIPVPEDVFNRYPHQLSGGMSQRIIIAMALSCNPKVIIADEPTTALDVTIQAQVLELMMALKEKNSVGILLITHDLGVVAEMCDRVMVMYCGRIVESADVETLFENPLHPYTRGLIKSVPQIGNRSEVMHYIKGRVPDLSQLPKGCKFAPRCEYAKEICHEVEPDLLLLEGEREVRCHLVNERGEFNG